MNERAPFTASDLEELDARLLSRAERVVPMRDIHKGDRDPRVIGLRHDVDDNPGSLETALLMAEWECRRGYSSTYYLLHSAAYWETALMLAPQFEELGHEVGIHVNAIAHGLRIQKDPHSILTAALADLRDAGVRVRGCAAHGDPLCRDKKSGDVVFANDEMFTETTRPALGLPNRTVIGAGRFWAIKHKSHADYGLEYDAAWLPRGDYISDSGGRWNPRTDSFELAVEHWSQAGQLHLLIHPDWWAEAFVPQSVPA